MNEITEDISSFEPGVFEPTRRTLVRFEFEGGPLYFPFDLTVYPATTYDIATADSSGTLTNLEIDNMSEAGTMSFLVNGIPITFTSGDTGDTFPATILHIPSGGVWNLVCSQSVSDGDSIQVEMIAFDDSGVLFSGLQGFLSG